RAVPSRGVHVSAVEGTGPLRGAAPQAASSPGGSDGHSGAAFDAVDELGHLVVNLATFLHEPRDLLHGMDDGGVVPAPELAGDGGGAEIGQFPEHVHADLASVDQWPTPAGAAEVRNGEPEGDRNRVHDHFRGDLTGAVGVEDVRENLLGHFAGGGYPVEAGEGRHPDEGAFELPDVVPNVGGDELEDLPGNGDVLSLGLFAEDGQAGFELGGLDVGRQTPLEAAAETIFQGGDGAGMPI